MMQCVCITMVRWQLDYDLDKLNESYCYYKMSICREQLHNNRGNGITISVKLWILLQLSWWN